MSAPDILFKINLPKLKLCMTFEFSVQKLSVQKLHLMSRLDRVQQTRRQRLPRFTEVVTSITSESLRSKYDADISV